MARLAALLIVAATLFVLVPTSEAGHRPRQRTCQCKHCGAISPYGSPRMPCNCMYNARVHYFYGQYWGGFHARYYQSLGMPSGDIGLRGTPW
jgi:hypothetical protein